MSIAGKEAREEYWNEIGLQAVMLRTAYVAGRTAEPCEEQVEAVAKCLADTSDGWDTLTEADREPFRETAAEILQVARKAVM